MLAVVWRTSLWSLFLADRCYLAGRLQPAAGQVTGDPHLPGPDGQYHQPRSSNPALVQVTTQVSLSHQPSASLRLSSRHLRRESPAGAQRQGHLPFPNR
ncbi:hypothetical protein AV530_012069 [Patagioenas fasciata monilis]|uniref:Secreted protein n=1 Tax=Patagioenas fasciata monilis TaxID=372326 RepID=A0A1V4JUS2_PATFA|nr:hypothetical protein AV530_012069 [Patagioenas fasciata monilis]